LVRQHQRCQRELDGGDRSPDPEIIPFWEGRRSPTQGAVAAGLQPGEGSAGPVDLMPTTPIAETRRGAVRSHGFHRSANSRKKLLTTCGGSVKSNGFSVPSRFSIALPLIITP